MRTLAILLLVYGFAPLPAASQAARKPAARPVPKAKPSAPDEAPLQPPAGLPADASRWMRSLTLRQQIAQLIVIPCFGENPNSRSADYANFSNLIENVGVGGVVVVNRVVNGVVKNAHPFDRGRRFRAWRVDARGEYHEVPPSDGLWRGG
jgi:beta-N-acetylhexosaminidase